MTKTRVARLVHPRGRLSPGWLDRSRDGPRPRLGRVATVPAARNQTGFLTWGEGIEFFPAAVARGGEEKEGKEREEQQRWWGGGMAGKNMGFGGVTLGSAGGRTCCWGGGAPGHVTSATSHVTGAGCGQVT